MNRTPYWQRASDQQIRDVIETSLKGIKLYRSDPKTRGIVRALIVKVRQLRGILEARSLRQAQKNPCNTCDGTGRYDCVPCPDCTWAPR